MAAAVAAPAPTFEPVAFRALPGWEDDDHLAALRAFVASCPKVIAAATRPEATGGTHAAARLATPAFLAACDDAARLAGQRTTRGVARAYFESHFVPHRVRHAEPTGLLTGYYEPLIDGSRTATAGFQAPVYRRPADLVNLVEEAERGAKGSALTHARKTASGFEPYPTRAEIEQGLLEGKGLELVYLADPVDLFFMQIQGSGRIRLRDGSMIRLAYDGKNGHPYTSIGRHLIETGAFPADRMSLDALGRWLKADAERGRRVMWQNKSYVFFREMTGAEADAPQGVLKIPLTPGRSLAVDAGIHTIGLPIYVDAPNLTHVGPGGFHRLMVAHDVGSAIKGAERGDIYFGSGASAGRLAGVTKHPGHFFVLLPQVMPAVAKSKPQRAP
jgi:membrane-bound lytic murein transglycosylase A